MAYNDAELKKIVEDQLFWDSRVARSAITVKVYNGIVTLEGEVSSYVAREAAEADVLQIPGVVTVNDRTVIRTSAVQGTSDEELQARILNRYLWNPNIPASDIDVSVNENVVVLKGSVDAYWKKIRAEEIAYDVDGVLHVSNELAVVPTHEYSDKVIAEDIMNALERNSDVDQESIEITVESGKVTLNGVVRDSREDYMVQEVARFTRGVKDVESLLRVERKAA